MKKALAITTAALLFVALPAGAATFTWVGSGGGGDDSSWNDANNWEDESNNPGVPGAGDTATGIPNGKTLENFDGQSVGNLEGDGRVNFDADGGATFTFDNSGSDVLIDCGSKLHSKDGTVLDFDDDAEIIAPTFILVENTDSKLTGDATLTIKGELWTRRGGDVQVTKVVLAAADGGAGTVAGEINIDGDDGKSGQYAGVDISMATGTVIRGDFTLFGDLGDLITDTGDEAYFNTSSNDTVKVASWKVGSTNLGIGTYNASSTDTGDADFSALFGSAANLSIEVVPEPATMAILGLGGVGLLIRRRRS
jgi:hypothetical protein